MVVVQTSCNNELVLLYIYIALGYRNVPVPLLVVDWSSNVVDKNVTHYSIMAEVCVDGLMRDATQTINMCRASRLGGRPGTTSVTPFWPFRI